MPITKALKGSLEKAELGTVLFCVSNDVDVGCVCVTHECVLTKFDWKSRRKLHLNEFSEFVEMLEGGDDLQYIQQARRSKRTLMTLIVVMSQKHQHVSACSVYSSPTHSC